MAAAIQSCGPRSAPAIAPEQRMVALATATAAIAREAFARRDRRDPREAERVRVAKAEARANGHQRANRFDLTDDIEQQDVGGTHKKDGAAQPDYIGEQPSGEHADRREGILSRDGDADPSHFTVQHLVDIKWKQRAGD